MVALHGGGANQYVWSNGIQNGVPFTPQATTTYTVTGTNSYGCTNTAQVTVTVSPQFNLTASVTDASSYGASDGAIDLTISGGVPPYTILWSNGATTEDLYNISAGTYTVNVTNADGCITSLTVTVQQSTIVVNIIDNRTRAIIYPNPTTGDFIVAIRSNDILENVIIEIFDALGQKVLQHPFTPK